MPSELIERDLLTAIREGNYAEPSLQVYADWLQQQGRTAKAELLRLEVARKQSPFWSAAQVGLRLREMSIWEGARSVLLREIPRLRGVSFSWNHGGFPDAEVASFDVLVENQHVLASTGVLTIRVPAPRTLASAQRLVRNPALLGLEVWFDPAHRTPTTWLAACPALSELRELTIEGPPAAPVLEPLSDANGLIGLRRLSFRHVPSVAIQPVVRYSIPALRNLEITGPIGSGQTTNELLDNLAGWSSMQSVRSLTLTAWDLDSRRAATILHSPHLAALRWLGVGLSETTNLPWAEGPWSRGLEGLSVHSASLGDDVLDGAPTTLREIEVRSEVGVDLSFLLRGAVIEELQVIAIRRSKELAPLLTALAARAKLSVHSLDLHGAGRMGDIDRPLMSLLEHAGADGLHALMLEASGGSPRISIPTFERLLDLPAIEMTNLRVRSSSRARRRLESHPTLLRLRQTGGATTSPW